ncbi:MAG: amidohydrolase family protein [Halobacteriales archaeon]
MLDIRIDHGRVVTMNPARDVIADGAVGIRDNEIVAVGPTDELAAEHDADRIIDASGHAVLPGFVDAHAHVNDILIRGGLGTDRALHDWLFNVNKPAAAVMTPDDHAIAAALYCRESLQSGITTFVDNAAGGLPGMLLDRETIEARLDVYRQSGTRTVYAQEFVDDSFSDDRFRQFLINQQRKHTDDGDIDPNPGAEPTDTEDAIEYIESLIEEYHGSADGRQSVWPAPLYPWAMSPEGLQGAYELAETYDVMTTTHASEVTQQERFQVSSIEYLNNAEYLGERTLLGHCVHVDERDIRLLAGTDTRVAHNVLTNHALGSGIAPVPTMLNYGLTVGIGTDNASASDTVNMVNDLRFAAHAHKANRQDAGAMTAEKVLEMATIDGARAIGRSGELGSLEAGKLADVVLLDLEHTHLTPAPNVVSAIVYQAQGFEVNTVICDGQFVVEDRQVPGIDDVYPDLLERAQASADGVIERAGLEELAARPWTSISLE